MVPFTMPTQAMAGSVAVQVAAKSFGIPRFKVNWFQKTGMTAILLTVKCDLKTEQGLDLG
jgi:hypothetical protein